MASHWFSQRTLQGMLLALFLGLSSCQAQPRTEILWDTYGVPHIFSPDSEGMFEAQGWAQMEAHGDLILRLFGQARGRAAEYWGEEYLESDIRARTLSLPERAASWSRAQDIEMGRYLQAFVQGMNSYALEHPEAIGTELEVVLPVKMEDVMAHFLRAIHYTFVSSPGAVPGRLQEGLYENALGEAIPGSNAWAIGPSRSASGNALLLANPHLPWSDLYTWFENHLVGPDFDAYGATLIGIPLVVIGFTDNLGWTHTVNSHDGSDLYELTLQGDGYLYDGEVRAFDVKVDTLKVRQEDGTVLERALTVKGSVHGPVVGMEEGKAFALRVVGIDDAQAFRQYYEMLRAETLAELEGAMSMLQLPMFTTMYADREGHIMHLFNGLVPRRQQGDVAYWIGVIPGNTSETLWSEYHPYADLPKVIDPESGWLQNANDPPWTTTFPRPSEMDPTRYAPYMAPQFMHARAQISAGMLLDDESITFDEMVEYKHSTHLELADRLLGELTTKARESGSERARAAAEVLEAWDGNADAESRGAVLFLVWGEAFYRETQGNPFATEWDPSDALNTPSGLADPGLAVEILEDAADSVLASYGALDVPFGEVYRVRRDDLDLPGNGFGDPFGVFRAAWYAPAEEGKFEIFGGDSFVLAVEFADPIRAMAAMGYGNASQGGSPHRTDQLSLFSEKKLRPVWRTRDEVEANLESRLAWQEPLTP